MSEKPRLLDLYEDKRNQRIILQTALVLFMLMQLVIYFVAANRSGEQSFVSVTDAKGNQVYETRGTGLTNFEKLAFLNTFGPLDNYNVNIKTKTVPFPFRAWLSAAVGIPIGLVLLVAFIIKAYFSLLYGEEEPESQKEQSDDIPESNLFGSLFHAIQRISIFHIGFLVTIGVLTIWLVPNFISGAAHFGLSTIRQYKWFFAAFLGVFTGVVCWIIYLRYRLSAKMIEKQLDLDKFRIEMQLESSSRSMPQLVNGGDQGKNGKEQAIEHDHRLGLHNPAEWHSHDMKDGL